MSLEPKQESPPFREMGEKSGNWSNQYGHSPGSESNPALPQGGRRQCCDKIFEKFE